MFKKDTETLRRYLLICLITLTALCIAILLHRFGPPLLRDMLGFIGIALAPFAIAWLAAIFMQPMARALSRYLHLSYTLAVLLTMLFCLAVLALIIMALVLVVGDVVAELLIYFSDSGNSVMLLFERLQQLYSYLDINFDQLQQWLGQLADAAGSLAGQGVGIAVSIAKATPTALLLVIVSLVAMFYWCLDEEAVKRLLTAPFPAARKRMVLDTYDSISQVVGSYLRAQVLLVTISIVISIAGLSILRIPSALPMGLLAGVLDLIPMLGPGTLLIPWGLWMLLSGQVVTGLGLLLVLAAVVLVRNIVQPKIIGDRVGLHPLAALASLFIGMELFGAVGLILGPVTAALAVAIWRVHKTSPPLNTE